jgi:hypothetical protein
MMLPTCLLLVPVKAPCCHGNIALKII